MTTPALPLELIGAGEACVIEDVCGEPGWIGQMASYGLRPGCELCVLQPGSPCLLQVGGARICLRGDDVMRIFVRPTA